jgi:putative transposase
MDKKADNLAEQLALFRYGLIADLARTALEHGELQRRLDEKASREYVIPGSNRTRVAEGTLRDWLRAYKAGGFDALRPRPRVDAGVARALPPDVQNALAKIKQENPKLSVRQCIKVARARALVPDDVALPPSTVHRMLSTRGLMEPSAPTPVDRRRFAYALAGELWMSDVMHGPALQGKKTFLICFIDDATRVIPYAQFCRAESIAAFLPVFRGAIARRGIPQRLFVDNGANYRCHQLSIICARLGISLIHATPYSPQSKGKQERFFRTLRAQFLAMLNLKEVTGLDDLNRRLWAYIEGEYHAQPHSAHDGETPLSAWARCGETVRYPDRSMDLESLFLMEAQRTVNRDRTVSLFSKLYEVDAALIGQKVTLRYDPGKTDAPLQVHDAKGRHVGEARPLNVHVNAALPRNRLKFSDGQEG